MERQMVAKSNTPEAKTSDCRQFSLSYGLQLPTKGFLNSGELQSNRSEPNPVTLQTKPSISQPGDPYEKEVNWGADTMKKTPAPLASSNEFSKVSIFPDKVQRKCLNSFDQNIGFSPSRLSADRALQPQRTAGNQAVQRLIKSGTLQAKLIIGQPDEIYEQEADRVAEQVMRMPDLILQRKCPKCNEDEEKILQANESPGHVPMTLGQDAPHIVHEVLSSPGQPLEPNTRAFMEQRFGRDFSRVRVHSGSTAEQSAQKINAHAYTVGHNIVFGAGRFVPGTHEGRKLIAHELTHVVQQTGPSNFYLSSVEGIQRSSRREEIEHPPSKLEEEKPASESEQWIWWGQDCKPAPKNISADQILDRVKSLINGARAFGLNLAADNLENYLLGKKSQVNLPTELVATNPLVINHLGPDSNPQPSEEIIRSTMGEKKGIENLNGEHHVVFLGGALKRLESGEVKLGQQFNMYYNDSFSFYTQGGGKYPDLAYGIGGCTVYSEVTVETALEGSETLMHYKSWKSWISDTYNFDKGKVALFPMGFCIPDSDLVRLKEAGYAKDFYMSTPKWSNPSKWLSFWFKLPYRLTSQK